MNSKIGQEHQWKFFRAGGVYQASIQSGADIANIGSLDRKLWAALACPTRGVFFDEKTLDILDSDSDGRIRREEVVAACEWVCSLIKDPDTLLEGSPSLRLSEIDDSSEEGRTLLESAREVLKDLGKPGADEISVGDFADEKKIFAATAFNADGVITPLSTDDDALRAALADIVKVMGPVADRSGLDGANLASISGFFDRLSAYAAWAARPSEDPSILPYGGDTAALYGAYSAVCAKIDDYFTRAEVLRYDPSSAPAVNASADELSKALAGEVSASAPALAALPIARVSSADSLDLSSGVNPAWAEAASAFVSGPLARAGGGAVLSRAAWASMKSAFAPYAAWTAEKADGGISALGPDRVAELLKTAPRAALEALVERDMAVKSEVENIAKVEKLVRLNRDLCELLNNFVSFSAFYKRGGAAMFQVGRLYIDQRACDLCIRVEDAAKHAALSPLSYMYLVYCDCSRKGEAAFSIAAAVTAGDCDNLIVGRNGVFYDRLGRDWDATITKIVSNPISVRQAFWSPYKRFIAWAGEQIAKRAGAADADVMKNMTEKAPAQGGAKKMDIGTLAAIGVAVGGVTTAFSVVLGALVGAGIKLPLYIIGAVLMISLPSMVIAALKLRLRNLGPLLDANSWAVNTRAKLNMMLGACLTQSAKPPRGFSSLKDPFEKKRFPWFWAVAGAAVAAACVWWLAAVHGFAPNPFSRAPAASAQEAASAPAQAAEKAPAAAAEK